jgi:hypothetical protein
VYGIILAVVGLALLAVQPSCLSATLRVKRAAEQSSAWPTAEGMVVRSEVSRFRAHKYKPIVTYEYSVAGRSYSSSVLAFDRVLAPGMSINFVSGTAEPSTTVETEARRLVEQFPAGTKVRVSYDPAAPATACLIPGTAGGWVGDTLGCGLGLVVSLALVFAGGALLVSARRDARRAAAAAGEDADRRERRERRKRARRGR